MTNVYFNQHRCAMQFTLVREPDIDLPWSCKIMLRYEYDSNGQPLNTSRTEDFVTLVREQDVEINLRRAQLAILSVSYTKDVAKFKDMSSDQLTWYYEQHKNVVSSFSKNTVVVTISAPGVTELTFVDLPGKITSLILALVNLTILYRACQQRFGRRHQDCH